MGGAVESQPLSAKAGLSRVGTPRFHGNPGYIAKESGSVAVARRFVDTLRQQCRKLASLPGTLGRARPELRPDIRSFAFRNYVIFFRYGPGTFEVVNVIEGHRDIIAYFRDDRA